MIDSLPRQNKWRLNTRENVMLFYILMILMTEKLLDCPNNNDNYSKSIMICL